MRIMRAFIHNFKSLKSAYLPELGHITAFIGRNNAGKSNVLSALRTAYTCLTSGSPAGLYLDIPENPKDLFFGAVGSAARIWMTIEIDENMSRYIVGRDDDKHVTLVLDLIQSGKNVIYLFSQIAPGRFVCDSGTPVLEFEPFWRANSDDARSYALTPVNEQRRRNEIANLREALTTVNSYDLATAMVPLEQWLRDRLPAGTMSLVNRMDLSTVSGLAAEIESTINRRVSALTRANETRKRFESSITSDISRLFYGLKLYSRVLWEPERRNAISPGDAVLLDRFARRREHKGQFSRLKDIMSRLYGVDLEVYQVETNEARVYLSDFLADANGGGVRESLKILLDVESVSPSALLIEEPEVYLHPKAQEDLFDYLEELSKTCQVFLSTHSTVFVDQSRVLTTYAVRQSASQTDGQRTPAQSDVDLLTSDSVFELVDDLGLKYSQVFFRDAIVFVEGPHDKEVLLTLAEKLGLSLAHSNIEFVPLGGCRNIFTYANKDIVEALSRHRIRYHFVIDRDEKSNEDVAALTAYVGADHLTVLERRELENYFLVPTLIQRFVALKATKGPAPTITEIECALKDGAEELKEFVAAKRVASALFTKLIDRKAVSAAGKTAGGAVEGFERLLGTTEELIRTRRSEVATLMAVELQQIDSGWDPLASPPGDELLDMVCRKFDVRFKKDGKDGEKMAQLATIDEIPDELRKVITAIRDLCR